MGEELNIIDTSDLLGSYKPRTLVYEMGHACNVFPKDVSEDYMGHTMKHFRALSSMGAHVCLLSTCVLQ